MANLVKTPPDITCLRCPPHASLPHSLPPLNASLLPPTFRFLSFSLPLPFSLLVPFLLVCSLKVSFHFLSLTPSSFPLNFLKAFPNLFHSLTYLPYPFHSLTSFPYAFPRFASVPLFLSISLPFPFLSRFSLLGIQKDFHAYRPTCGEVGGDCGWVCTQIIKTSLDCVLSLLSLLPSIHFTSSSPSFSFPSSSLFLPASTLLPFFHSFYFLFQSPFRALSPFPILSFPHLTPSLPSLFAIPPFIYPFSLPIPPLDNSPLD